MNVESFCVTFGEPIAVFVNAANEVAGHADVDRAAGPACKNVEKELAQCAELA